MLNSDGWVWLYAVPWLKLPAEYLTAVEAARKPHRLDFDFTAGQPVATTPKTPPDQLGLTISAKHRVVEEQAWIWINERPAGQSTAGPSAWNSAFEIDISQHVRPGSNDLYVRVHNKVGPGGIWKSVKLFTDKDLGGYL